MDIKGAYGVFKTTHTTKTSRQQKTTEESSPTQATESGGTDVATFSTNANFQVALATETRKMAATSRSNEAAVSSRIESLKNDYQGDNCPISGDTVAEAILAKIRGTRI